MGRPKTKLVLRHFPPTFTSPDFDRLLSSLALLPLVDWLAVAARITLAVVSTAALLIHQNYHHHLSHRLFNSFHI